MRKEEETAPGGEQQKKLTISDVADALGVSKTTVSRVISGKGRIGSETRSRVLSYIEEHQYRPNAVARGLAQSKTYNIALVLPGDYNLVDLPFFQNCMIGIGEVAASMDYDIIVSMILPSDISQLERIVNNNKVDGVILTRTLTRDQPTEFLLRKRIPFVTIGTSMEDQVVQVDNDHREACEELVTLLLMQGMRRIALIGGNKTHVVTQSRYQGYEDAFTNKEIPVDPELVYLDVESPVVIEKTVEELLKKEVECMVCMDDSVCIQVLNALDQKQIRIPEQMKVASFYSSMLLETHIMGITSLQFDIRELGMVTCRTLLDLINGKAVEQKKLLGYQIALRESTKSI